MGAGGGDGGGGGGVLLSKEIKVESFGELPVRELPKVRRGGNWPRSKAVVEVCWDQQECDVGGRHTVSVSVSVSVPQPGPLHSDTRAGPTSTVWWSSHR